MFDYKTIFKGEFRGHNINNGPIYLMDLLLMHTPFKIQDIKYLDYFFSKFIEYSPTNYISNSRWGNSWNVQKRNKIEILKSIIKDCKEGRVEFYNYNIHLSALERCENMNPEDVYWKDSYFFITNYSKLVYKAYLNGQCDINRFIKVAHFNLNNIEIQKSAITNVIGWDTRMRTPIIEQYLIYLEKQKMYKECIEVITQVKDKGWSNDFEKRLNRCLNKIL
jgi:hypothetical protein